MNELARLLREAMGTEARAASMQPLLQLLLLFPLLFSPPPHLSDVYIVIHKGNKITVMK